MFRAVHIVAACVTLLTGVLADVEERVVIDSHGTHLNSVMRRETASLHRGKRQDPEVPADPVEAPVDPPADPTLSADPEAADDAEEEETSKVAEAEDKDPNHLSPDAPLGNATVATGIDESELTTQAPTPAPVIPDPAPKSGAERKDLSFNYVEEKLPGGCIAHYMDAGGHLDADACAERCYNTFGCTRFSAGPDCATGCRISNVGRNPGTKKAIPEDGQCQTSAEGDASTCITYKLSFFHAVDQPGSCSSHFTKVADANNKNDCAHACKNTPGCKKFSAEPNCMGGCRISACDQNAAGGSKCPKDNQCELTTEKGCTVYELFR